MDNLAISVAGLNKSYEGASSPALQNVNLTIRKNTIFGLLGPNGAGKSTLINILAGITRKTSGQINILGLDLDKEPLKIKYLLGIVPQEVYLDTFLSIKDALEFYAGYFRIKPDDRKTKQIIEDMGLGAKINSTPRMLSGGMKRRLLVAKALVHSPPILILDEPTAGVDVELRSQLWDYILKLKDRGATIILTTHYLAEAEHLCDDIAFIDEGKVVLSDKKEHLLKTLGAKKMIIEFDNLVDVNDPKFNKWDIKDNKLTINFDSEQDLNNLLCKVIDLGIKIKDIRTQSDDLEAIYKKILVQ
ncbi:multidrug ABC transporter ATP-binding protein [Candidatus Phycorickettsia trachydisci]|uniref:Multidrug ABC transporter ATP-binding protein n=1 Tax=Candidatus Phycorickettsia trachydisci TaxID=2115978 RepID=A0A2P1P8W0_9RICK|nr:ABC transporter ATP-binding protein [Candidatus Phycorickettsia trachydisci]AVP87703.1 multidrug ABC transporter ATP-binding protein [Candidatus Phycorickettsia trachydisci]